MRALVHPLVSPSVDRNEEKTASRGRGRGNVAAAVTVAAIFSLLNQASGKPANVVIIVPDDVSYDDFGFSNARPEAPLTPQLDRLGSESVRLTDFHVSPTCSPTRAALMTGRYNNATGVWHTILGRYFLREGEVTIADVFRANGYRTALFASGIWAPIIHFGRRIADLTMSSRSAPEESTSNRRTGATGTRFPASCLPTVAR